MLWALPSWYDSAEPGMARACVGCESWLVETQHRADVFPHSVIPGRLPLTGHGGEECGEMLHLAEWQEQPPGGPAALSIR